MPLLTKTLFFLAQGDPLMVRTPPMRAPFGNKLRAYDKTSGTVVWETEFPAGATGANNNGYALSRIDEWAGAVNMPRRSRCPYGSSD